MKNKLDKEYLLETYKTYESNNILYALTILNNLGLTEWFKKIDMGESYSLPMSFLCNYPRFISMYDLDRIKSYNIYHMIRFNFNAIQYFNQDHLNKLDKYEIGNIIHCKPELEKYLINCTNYEKQTK